MEWRRQNAANRLVTRGSPGPLPSSDGSATTYSIQPAGPGADVPDSHMDLIFNIQKGRLSLATRRCATKGERRERIHTITAETISNGLLRSSRNRPVERSAISANVI